MHGIERGQQKPEQGPNPYFYASRDPLHPEFNFADVSGTLVTHIRIKGLGRGPAQILGFEGLGSVSSVEACRFGLGPWISPNTFVMGPNGRCMSHRQSSPALTVSSKL